MKRRRGRGDEGEGPAPLTQTPRSAPEEAYAKFYFSFVFGALKRAGFFVHGATSADNGESPNNASPEALGPLCIYVHSVVTQVGNTPYISMMFPVANTACTTFFQQSIGSVYSSVVHGQAGQVAFTPSVCDLTHNTTIVSIPQSQTRLVAKLTISSPTSSGVLAELQRSLLPICSTTILCDRQVTSRRISLLIRPKFAPGNPTICTSCPPTTKGRPHWKSLC